MQAAAGVVADSIPEAEYEECIHKSHALFDAAKEAIRLSSTGGNNPLIAEIPHI